MDRAKATAFLMLSGLLPVGADRQQPAPLCVDQQPPLDMGMLSQTGQSVSGLCGLWGSSEVRSWTLGRAEVGPPGRMAAICLQLKKFCEPETW